MKKTLLALTALFVLSFSSLAAEPPSAPGDLAVPSAQHAIFFRPRGFHPRGTALAAACANRNLPYRGGPVIPSAKVVYIFWGPSFNNASSADYQYARELIAFRNLLGGTPEYNVITQYSQAGGIFSQFIQRANLAAGTADWFDTSTPPTNVTDALVQREVQTYLASHPFDSSTVYEVFIPSSSYSSFSSTSTSCGGPALSYCAYHSSYGSGANAVKYSIQPYPSCGGC